MARRPRSQREEPNGRWLTAVPNWLTAFAAVAGVVVTGIVGLAGLERAGQTPTPVAQVSVAPMTMPAVSIAPASDQGAGAPPANVGGGAEASRTPPVVSIATFGWDGDILLVDGTVAKISGPLWLAVQPATSAPDTDWRATPMDFAVGDDWDVSRAFAARFSDAVRADRYHIKVFQDGTGFGAGGAPGPDLGDELEAGGAADPSEILDIVLDAGT